MGSAGTSASCVGDVTGGRSSVRPPVRQVCRARGRRWLSGGSPTRPGGRRPGVRIWWVDVPCGGLTSDAVGWRTGFRGADPPSRTSTHEMGRSGHVRADTQRRAGPEPAGWDTSWRAGTGRGGLGQVVAGWDRSWWAGTGRGGFGGGHFGCLAGCVWGGLSEGRLGCAARQDVSVPGCWPGQAFTPETGRPAGRGGRGRHFLSSCTSQPPTASDQPPSSRSRAHRPPSWWTTPAVAATGRGSCWWRWDRCRAAGPGTPSGVLGQVVPCPQSPVPVRGRGGSRGRPGPETGRRGRDLGQDVVRAPGTQTSPLSRSTPGRRSPTHRAGVGQPLR